jgi:hypothetical protein
MIPEVNEEVKPLTKDGMAWVKMIHPENWMTENLSIFAFVPRAKILPQTPCDCVDQLICAH